MSGDIFKLFEQSSFDGNSQLVDSTYFRSLSGFVPKDSGIQNVFPSIQMTKMLAENFHWKFVPYALKMAKAMEYGISSLSSEGGSGVKSLNTMRNEQHFSGKNTSMQKKDSWDAFLYGNKIEPDED